MHRQRLAMAVLALALTAGACSDDGDSDGSSESVDLPDGAAAVVDDYYETVAVQHDGDAMLALVTEDFEFVSDDGTLSRESWAAQVNRFFEDFTVERLDDPVVVGGGTEYLVSQAEHVTGTGIDDSAFSVFRVVEVDGVWLIDSQQYTDTAAP